MSWKPQFKSNMTTPTKAIYLSLLLFQYV